MKTQISRNSFKAAKRYSGVYQQQGRMLTDADWNNLVDILKGHLAEALKDVVGNGSPRTGKLKITTDRQIQPGDLYVGGLRAELPGTNPIDANTQEDFPGSPNLPATGPYIVYADVWERSLTALEDPDLRDAGLNGADTCTRTQTMLQVKVCPEDVDPEKDIPQHGDASLTLTLHDSQESDDPCDPCAGQIGADEGRIGNYLFRVEVHLFEEETEDQPTRLILKWSSENGAEQYEAQDEALMPPGFVVSGRYTYEFLNLMSEKHLGVHLNPDPDFSPTFFELKQTYEIPEKDPDDPDWYVRRWDGYCELTYDGSIWSLVEGFDKGVTLSTAVADTAPGHVSLNSALSINLEALKLDLELKDKKFVAGDYWLAPVRENEHDPGSAVLDDDLPDGIVLDGVPPEGIVHHYLRLVGVDEDGAVEDLDNDDAEKRRHNFPPLTDLLAGDIGYLRDPTDDCANGWFDDTHDNVEKALNRLCELTAAYIPYTADCSQGLFQGFEGTVKDALDRVCTIQAKDVGFAKPCDTGFFQGQTVATVADALGLLCTAQTQTGGGCRVTVGQGGQFDTLAEAIETLLGKKSVDICLCLLPGEHIFGGTWRKDKGSEYFNLAIIGCGAGTKVILESPPAFIGLSSLKLENFVLDGMQEDLPLTVEGCTEVDISNLHHVGLAQKNPLIRVTGGERVRLAENILETYTKDGLKEKESGLLKPQKVFAFDKQLADLYAIPLRNDFLGPAGERAEAWAGLHQNERLKIAGDILAGFEGVQKEPENLRFTLDEEVAYQRLMEVLTSLAVDALALLDRLRDVRDQAHHTAAGIGIVFMDASASAVLADNLIFGSVALYGFPGEEDLSIGQIDELQDKFDPPARIRLLSSGASLQAWDNRITRLTVGLGMTDLLVQLLEPRDNPDDKVLVQGLYRTALFESNIIAGSGNQLLFENLTLAANEVQTLAKNRVGWAFSKTGIYTGNRIQKITYTDLKNEEVTVGGGVMQTVADESAKAANLPQGNW